MESPWSSDSSPVHHWHGPKHTAHSSGRDNEQSFESSRHMPAVKSFEIASDFTSIALSLALLGFLGAALRLNGSSAPQNEFSRWHNAAAVLATIFPVVFASIIGRMMYGISRWKLERGTTMGSLEQVLGSRTVGSTILTQVHLRAINILGLALILIWAFSPLGAQSILRIFDFRLEPSRTPTTVSAQDTSQGMRLSDYDFGSAGNAMISQTYFSYLRSIYDTVLLAPDNIQTDTMDIWGNVKIPFLHEDHNSIDQDWRHVQWTPDREQFSALVGIAILDVPTGNSTFTVESAYTDVRCSNISTSFDRLGKDGDAVAADWRWGSLSYVDVYPRSPVNNGSWMGSSRMKDSDVIGDRSWSIALDRFVDIYWFNETAQKLRRGADPKAIYAFEDGMLKKSLHSPAILINETSIDAGPTKLLFQGFHSSHPRNAGSTVTAFCDVRETYVESRIECRRKEVTARQNCTVVAQRPSQKLHASPNVSHLSFPKLFRHITEQLPLATFTSLSGLDLALGYLEDPSNLALNPDRSVRLFDNPDPRKFSRRLTQLLNTYILIGNFDNPIYRSHGPYQMPLLTAEGEVSVLVPIYRISMLWITLGFISSAVLFVGAVLGVIFTHLAKGPEILGYASTVLRDSKFIDTPADVRRMDGVDISRIMRSQRVRYGYSELTLEGRPLVGVGIQHEVTPITR